MSTPDVKSNFVNGSYVHRLWAGGSSELLAAFQYKGHASLFAATMARDETQPRGVSFSCFDASNGDLRVFPQPSTDTKGEGGEL